MAEPANEACEEKEEEKMEEEEDDGDRMALVEPPGGRHCTDAWCLIVLVLAWMAYIVVTVIGMADGNPAKLYLPRDYAGSYCGVEANWNDGPNLQDAESLTYTMNVTATTDTIVKKFLCSTAVSNQLAGGGGLSALLNDSEVMQYRCDCCLDPCKTCTGAYEVGGDLQNGAEAKSKIGDMMTDLHGDGSDLFNSGGANGDSFANMWSDATKYLNAVCMPNCQETVGDTPRRWVYTMAPDDPLKYYWDLLANSTDTETTLKETIETYFTFDAIPESRCPYHESLCIPFPGVDLKDSEMGYCTFEMASSVSSSIGSEAAEAMASAASDAIASGATETFGQWFGDFERAIPAFILMAFSSFVVGIIFMVLLRMFVKICTWTAIFMVFVALMLGGGVSYVRSFQCAGMGMFETTSSVASAAVVAATTTVNGEARSEELTGDGADYEGAQYKTRGAYTCAKWGEGIAAENGYNSSEYPDSKLEENYCRNPYKEGDINKGTTIWCYTTDATVTWQECDPVGVIKPICTNGYAVNDETIRQCLEILAYVLWAFAIIYLLALLFLRKRIQLAVAVNECAAKFVAQHPLVLLVPIIQGLIGVLWIALWAASASFLLSQVPDGYTPKGVYATYAEAYGTSKDPGACTGEWPTGSVYRDDNRCDTVTVDGQEIQACWRCSPPRYVFDARFMVSFFVFLWNNALNVAIGQCLIAGAAGVWFFTTNEKKGTKKAIQRGARNVFRYHLGSVAFGAFIIAVIQMIRAILYYYEQQAKAQKNRVMVLILKICRCLMWCFEKCMKFLNKNAYIQIALVGTNFCTSAKKAFFLILKNAVRFGTVALLGSMIHWIGWIFIVVATVALGYLYLVSLHPDVSMGINLAVYIAVAYVAAQVFMNVFGLAVDTILQCFLVCEEMSLSIGDGGEKGFVPRNMLGLLDIKPPSDDDEKADAKETPETKN